MTTLLKAHLRKTNNPLDMFEILLHEYYPTILKATGKTFVDAILDSGDSEVFSKETLTAFKKLAGASKRTKVGRWMNKDNPPFLLETVRENDGYEEESREQNLINFRNLLEKETKWDASKYGDLKKIIAGLNQLISIEDKRLQGKTPRSVGMFEAERSASKEKVVEVDKELDKDLKDLQKLSGLLTKVDLLDFEGKLVYESEVEDPLLELIPNNKAIEKLEEAAKPSYYFKPLNVKEANRSQNSSLNKLIRDDFEKEIKSEFEKLKREKFGLERLSQKTKPFEEYREERSKDFKSFKKNWLDSNYEQVGVNTENKLYTDDSEVKLFSKNNMKVNDLKEEIHNTLTAKKKYPRLDGSRPSVTLLDALLYAIEQKRGVVLERSKENRKKFLNDYRALVRELQEGELMALLQLQRIPVRVTLANNNLDWEEEKTNIKNYLNQEFDNVRYLKAAERLDGILPTGIFDFTEPLEGFDDNEFLDNFRNTFGNKVIVSTDRTELEGQMEND
tara:strand:- start:773 stop:2284 length:1512 start_codon:yes stop_codon:yes gene_type:complete